MSDQARQVMRKIENSAAANPVELFELSLKDWYKNNLRKIINLCGDEATANKLVVTAANCVAKNPKLIEADFNSFQRCLLMSAELGLFPGALQECAYVPLKNGRTGRIEVNFWPQYQGLVKLAYSSGFVKSVNCGVVYERDFFDFEKGTNTFLKHIPFLGDRKERGARKCVYACVLTSFNEWQIEVLSIDFIEGIKKRSPAARAPDSPWNTGDDNYDAMARKTALRQALKYVPKSSKLADVIDIDKVSDRPEFAQKPIFDLGGVASFVDAQEPQQKEEQTKPKEEPQQKQLDEPSQALNFGPNYKPEKQAVSNSAYKADNF